jgi:hypothetical protein
MAEPDARWKRDLTFVATDAKGKTYYLHVETRTTTTQHTQGSETTARGETRVVTSTGAVADRSRQGVYVVRGTNLTLTSTDPKAP